MDTIAVRMDTTDLDIFSRVLKENKSAVIRELVQDGKKHKAVKLYCEKRVSLGLGARLGGVTLSEFIDLLREHNADLNISEDDVDEALKTARKVW